MYNLRVESHHAALKRSLGNSLGNLESCWAKIHTLFEASHNAIKHSFEKSVIVALHKFKSVIYKDLRGVVSMAALEKIYVEMKDIESGNSHPLTCNHYLRKVCGLPCTHELDEYQRSGKPIPVSAIDRFWRKLDMEPILRNDCGDVGDEDMDNRFEDVVRVLIGRYKNTSDRSNRRILLRQTGELASPSTTTMVEPETKINVRGRPKNKKPKKNSEASTKRDPSLFEWKESMSASCTINDVVLEVPAYPKISEETTVDKIIGNSLIFFYIKKFNSICLFH